MYLLIGTFAIVNRSFMNLRTIIGILTAGLLSMSTLNGQNRPEPKFLFNQRGIETLSCKAAVQGTAIWKNYLFSMRDTGHCVVIDLKTHKLVAEFPLASAGVQNHANDAFFAEQRYSPEDKFPLLYVSQCKSQPVVEIDRKEIAGKSRLLFVERVKTDAKGNPCGTELVQVIEYEPQEWNSRLWAHDSKDPDFMWCYGNILGNAKPGNRIVVKKFKMPVFNPDMFLVTLNDADAVQTLYFDEAFPAGARGPQDNILQGAIVYDGVMYLPVGVGEPDYPSEIFCVDTRHLDSDGKPYLYGAWNYNDVIPCEMEDMDVWKGQLICTTNSHGRVRPVYAFPIKKMQLKSR